MKKSILLSIFLFVLIKLSFSQNQIPECINVLDKVIYLMDDGSKMVLVQYPEKNGFSFQPFDEDYRKGFRFSYFAYDQKIFRDYNADLVLSPTKQNKDYFLVFKNCIQCDQRSLYKDIIFIDADDYEKEGTLLSCK